jgi:hypothetical protein
MINDTEMMTTSKNAVFILDLSRLASYHKRPNVLGEGPQQLRSEAEQRRQAVPSNAWLGVVD